MNIKYKYDINDHIRSFAHSKSNLPIVHFATFETINHATQKKHF